MKTLATWRRDARWLEERQRGNPLRGIEGELEGDRAAVGMADHVGALDAEVVQQGTRVGGLLGDGARSSMSAAAGEAAAVIVDEPVVIGKGWLRQKRGVGIRQDGIRG